MTTHNELPEVVESVLGYEGGWTNIDELIDKMAADLVTAEEDGRDDIANALDWAVGELYEIKESIAASGWVETGVLFLTAENEDRFNEQIQYEIDKVKAATGVETSP